MAESRGREVHRINCLNSEMDALYHQASVKMGISDSVSIILYNLYEAGGSCLLRDICTASGISKQTLNSGLRTLEARQLLQLEQHNGRSKRVTLTEAGREFAQHTVARLFQADMDAFGSWTEEEIRTYVRLQEKYTACLRQQIEKLWKL